MTSGLIAPRRSRPLRRLGVATLAAGILVGGPGAAGLAATDPIGAVAPSALLGDHRIPLPLPGGVVDASLHLEVPAVGSVGVGAPPAPAPAPTPPDPEALPESAPPGPVAPAPGDPPPPVGETPAAHRPEDPHLAMIDDDVTVNTTPAPAPAAEPPPVAVAPAPAPAVDPPPRVAPPRRRAEALALPSGPDARPRADREPAPASAPAAPAYTAPAPTPPARSGRDDRRLHVAQRPPAAVVTTVRAAADAAVAAGRSPWMPVGVLLGVILYLSGQRALDRGSKLAYAGRAGDPDDELIEL